MKRKQQMLRLAAMMAAVAVTACGGGGGGGDAPAPVKTPDPLLAASASDASAYVNDFVAFNAGANESGVSYRWEFSDGQTLSGNAVERQFSKPGSYTASITAQSSQGTVSKGSVVVQVQSVPAAVPRPDGQLLADCSGAICGIDANGRYSGSGIGVWRYSNATAQSASVDIDIAGVRPGQDVTLTFSNGGSIDQATPPRAGVANALASAHAEAAAGGSSLARLEDRAHARALAANAQAISDMRRLPEQPPGGERRLIQSARSAAALPVANGTTRIWNDLHDSASAPTPYSTRAYASCTVAKGRRVVFWVDEQLTGLSDSTMAQLQDSFCGDNGTMSRTVALLGDVWGSAADRRWYWIKETAEQLQDVNMVILNTPSSSDWAGYFSPRNNILRAAGGNFANSNEALAFFIKGSGLIKNPPYYVSTLVHELTHLINYYQRWVSRGLDHDSWLEETSAMMSEDIMATTATPGYHKITQTRLPSYLASGAGVSLLKWTELDDDHYNLGGSFGAFLNRRYGLAVAQQLITDCTPTQSSYACLDAIIRKNGGGGFADEFARMGASVFGGMPSHGQPWGYGFRKVQAGDYLLNAVDTAALGAKRRSEVLGQLSNFGMTSHSYQADTVALGASRYVRRGVQVPPATTLTVVVR
ncbi:M30 family zinc metallopeptidase [Paucibacter soli]|uniref:M30 family zinc metallopeptidase n=1 Tax=Paucibacter soli TaxID=3133433 RepID=UPI0030B34C21